MLDYIWYFSLTKPYLTPPAWIFAPVWSFLYLTIAFSFVLYFLKKDENKGLGYLYFLVQMILNLIWTPVFFGTKNILLALIVIILMDVFIILTIKKFYEVRKFAGLILIPYLIWTLFATYLNFGYFILN
ncbi:TPA: tryptophan-rich sensory protein [Candidatus Galligastranaerophilus intestinavium]|uniref:Tryptophan-rich sensory protein n=1 Tax=Candidatus Galligastranaerophilus intestinavium TaxID=2840836 RepID=A0A9D1FJK2_9BACT|nr:tryptophan-rich sensory protein [Candidatus Galligastranaerophilus intestinavium]